MNKYTPPRERETKEDSFKRVMSLRVNRIIIELDLISNLSHKGNYKYSDKSVDKVFDFLREHLDLTQSKFTKKRKEKFTL